MRSSEKDWDKTERSINVYNIEDVATKVDKDKPLFAMRAGGVYAVKVGANEKLAGFIRLDKVRLPHKERKRIRRHARWMEGRS